MAAQVQQENTSSNLPDLSSTSDPITVPHTIHVGTRRSDLARKQTEIVIELLQQKWPQHHYEVHAVATMGDKNQITALHNFGAKSLWTHELEAMLLTNQVDFIVHSLKDIPTKLPPKCALSAVPPREDPRDALVFSPRFYPPHVPQGTPPPALATLPKGSIIGTSSVRRSAQLARLYPNLDFKSVRGNIGTRLGKLDAEDSEYAAIVLAAAGLLRVGWGHRISGFLESKNVEGGTSVGHGHGHGHETSAHDAAVEALPGTNIPDKGEDAGRGADDVEKRQGRIGDRRWGMLHAVGQGALGIEIREGDARITELLEPLRCQRSTLACLAERALMSDLEGGCSVPIGVETQWKDEEGFDLTMRAIVLSLDGKDAAEMEMDREIQSDAEADQFGRDVARALQDRGASSILDSINADRPALDEPSGE